LVLLRDTTSFYFFLRIGHYVSFGRATTKSILLFSKKTKKICSE